MNAFRRMKSVVRLIGSFKDPSVPIWIKVLPIVAGLYLISPIDFVPDVLPILGWIDDIVIVLGLLSQALKGLERIPAKIPPRIIESSF
ncbi:MAG: DUF1232 domain-containing protein [Armatimonadetes bacterium]|nr:DUF1232 domain-containing protein [Armatimonadota bacterium]